MSDDRFRALADHLHEALVFMRFCELSGEAGADNSIVVSALEAYDGFEFAATHFEFPEHYEVGEVQSTTCEKPLDGLSHTSYRREVSCVECLQGMLKACENELGLLRANKEVIVRRISGLESLFRIHRGVVCEHVGTMMEGECDCVAGAVDEVVSHWKNSVGGGMLSFDNVYHVVLGEGATIAGAQRDGVEAVLRLVLRNLFSSLSLPSSGSCGGVSG